MDRPHLLVAQCFGDRITFEPALVQTADSAIGADPHITSLILEQGARAEIAQPIAHLIVPEARRGPSADAFVSTNPNAAVFALQEGANEVVYQAGIRRVVIHAASQLAVYP